MSDLASYNINAKFQTVRMLDCREYRIVLTIVTILNIYALNNGILHFITVYKIPSLDSECSILLDYLLLLILFSI